MVSVSKEEVMEYFDSIIPMYNEGEPEVKVMLLDGCLRFLEGIIHNGEARQLLNEIREKIIVKE